MEDIPIDQIIKLPLFPKYNISEYLVTDGRVVTLKSAVYVHLDNGHIVSVYKVPVFSSYRIKRGKKIPIEIQEEHLRRCYRTGKYMLVTHETVKKYPLIDTISKLETEKVFNKNLYEDYL